MLLWGCDRVRIDSDGFFWNDIPPKVDKKQVFLTDNDWTEVFPGFWAPKSDVLRGIDPRTICKSLDNAYLYVRRNEIKKRNPPEPLWLHPEYLPHLHEALNHTLPEFVDSELIDLALQNKFNGLQDLVFDTECYPNYFLASFYSPRYKKVVNFQLSEFSDIDTSKLTWLLENFNIIGFNSIKYDGVMLSVLLKEANTARLKQVSDVIINEGAQYWQIQRKFGTGNPYTNHIDIIEVAPLFGSLKIYGGRLHTKRMQDLPFHPDAVLSPNQMAIIKWYCHNDLRLTNELYNKLKEEIDLRRTLGNKYRLKLLSKSDAQISEKIVSSQLYASTGNRIHAPIVEPGTIYNYSVPHFIRFTMPELRDLPAIVENTNFVVSGWGNIGLPQELKDLKIPIGDGIYKLGIGGLHSGESKVSHHGDEYSRIFDFDVTSYYPSIILNLELYPKHIGKQFLKVYSSIVKERIMAKQYGHKVVSESLKIAVNGIFGKFGNVYSAVYSPDLLMQVTITGQLSLLLLIEWMEMAGIRVLSANTDGLFCKCSNARVDGLNAVLYKWSNATRFQLEMGQVRSLYSRDVNNYIAVKQDKSIKTKGIFSDTGLTKNPHMRICADAVIKYLVDEIPIEKTINECVDITPFLSIRTVKGGAVKIDSDGNTQEFLGRAVRWYYAKEEKGSIVYAINGNLVPKSVGARPMMEIPDGELTPDDVDRDYYIKEAYKLLTHVGVG